MIFRSIPVPAIALATGIASVLACGGDPATATAPAATTTTTATPTAGAASAVAAAFRSNVTVRVTDTTLVIESNGIPDHAYGPFPMAGNPNSVLSQTFQFTVPRTPARATTASSLPMGPIGIMINGVVFYNPYNAMGNNAVEGPFAETFDGCDGHPDQRGAYHYHKLPSCLVRDTTGQHSSIYGVAFDGYAIYGPQGDGGNAPSDLDSCNGHTDATRGYHYHMSRTFPYLLGCFAGQR